MIFRNVVVSTCYDRVASQLIPVFHEETDMLKARLYSLSVLLILTLVPCKASFADDGALEMISIRADEAIEDIQPGILHFKGHFRMQSRDWQLESGLLSAGGQWR